MNTLLSVIAFSLLLMLALSRDARDEILEVHLEIRQNVTPPASNMMYMVSLNLKLVCCYTFRFLSFKSMHQFPPDHTNFFIAVG